MSPAGHKKAYIERDRHGRERVVLETTQRSNKRTTHELLEAAEDRERVLIAENAALRRTLSTAQRDSWDLRNLRVEYQNLLNDYQQFRYARTQLDAQLVETRKIEDKLEDEKDKVYRLEEKVRLMKRLSHESYKDRYEEKVNEVELLRRRMGERDELLRLSETRLEEKNRTVIYLKTFLRDRGFRVA